MIPYRVRRLLLGALRFLLIAGVCAGLALGVWTLWAGRYIQYNRDGAKLDFSVSPTVPKGALAEQRTDQPDLPIHFYEVEDTEGQDKALKQLDGYYVTTEMLKNLDSVSQALGTLPADRPVMMELKDIRGYFFYDTTLGPKADGIDTAAVNSLITEMHGTGRYLIAKIPALRDYTFALENSREHFEIGILVPNRGSFFMDAEHCYWLDPKAELNMTFLVSIVTELKNLGFDEVVFSDFRIPEGEIYYDGDKTGEVQKLAEGLIRVCGSETFAVSFLCEQENFLLPQGRARLYFENVDAASAATLAAREDIPDPAVYAVFLTDLMDTRFADYSVMHPLELGTT